jgi:hypothetical protein
MKNKLVNDQLLNELKNSAFFRGRVSPMDEKPETTKATTTKKVTPVVPQAPESAPTPKAPKPKTQTIAKDNHDTVVPRHHDTMVPRYHDTTVEEIRKAVKQIGKEAATHRYTVAEKQAIANIVFTYKNQGLFTSENEVSRIAINFIVADFEENGEESILAKALKALND